MDDSNASFVINDVVNDLLDVDKSLGSPLMRLNYFGRLTKNIELINFTTNEISGYKSDDVEVPRYRKTIGTLIVNVQNNTLNKNLEIPISVLEEPYSSMLRFMVVREGIAVVEQMGKELNKNDDNEREFFRPLPMEILPRIQPVINKVYSSNSRIVAQSAKLVGNRNIVLEIQSQLRAKLLELVMKLSEKFGYQIEIKNYNKNRDENNQTVIQFMNTKITNTGDGNVINTGDKSDVNADITVIKGNKEVLVTKLLENGISENDADELIQIIDEEDPKTGSGDFGNKVNRWIKKMLGKAVDGSWGIGIGAAGNLLAETIGKYYGS